jgi:hypothetical protein
MTIEELKAHDFSGDQVAFLLMPEILALVEATNPNDFASEEEWHTALFNARDAFNAKLEAL